MTLTKIELLAAAEAIDRATPCGKHGREGMAVCVERSRGDSALCLDVRCLLCRPEGCQCLNDE